MKAKQALDFNMERARNLLALYEERRKASKDHEDLLRASLVLAVGAIDAYVHDKVSENLVPFIRSVVKRNSGDIDPIERALKRGDIQARDFLLWLTFDRPFVKVRQVIDADLSLTALQNPGSIQNAFSLIGKKNVWKQCEKLMKRKEKEICDQLSKLADRRNKIVHEGDREKSRLRKHRPRPITADWVKAQLDFADELVHALDQLK